MKPERKRRTAGIWTERRFESFREATRHKKAIKAYNEMNPLKRPALSPALPHSKVYGR